MTDEAMKSFAERLQRTPVNPITEPLWFLAGDYLVKTARLATAELVADAEVERAKAFDERNVQLAASLAEVEDRERQAMAVLAPNIPESGLVDACKQIKQAAVSEADNSTNLERKLAEVEAERDKWKRAYQQLFPHTLPAASETTR